jgi:hypothetical protein
MLLLITAKFLPTKGLVFVTSNRFVIWSIKSVDLIAKFFPIGFAINFFTFLLYLFIHHSSIDLRRAVDCLLLFGKNLAGERDVPVRLRIAFLVALKPNKGF